ncbi:hypothetical protein DAEQUDRAFT_738943 [Daedalea quercina L-15889]|uniref:BAG domain-containing protein n=1 Tax=Daedalea quercina L-15889 TaxID=1314783 RepID=A0A165PBQ4_9APHY|nr:hypothetical protein DAEQUDRAFT_738943 [Daedalea quercina L-15889]
MLVLTPVSAFSSAYYPYPVISPVSIQNDYLEAVARARAEAVHHRRQQELRRRQVEEQRRQAALEAVYQQQILRERHRRLALARQREQAYVRALLEAQELQRAEQLRVRRAREQQLLSTTAALDSMFDMPTEVVQTQKAKPQVPLASLRPSSPVRRTPSPVSSARERLQQRLERESDPDVRGAVEGLLSVFPTTSQNAPVDHKGKGKAREDPVKATPTPVASTSTPTPATSPQPASGSFLKDVLQQRLQKEEDPEIKESLNNLFTKLYGAPKAATSSSAQDKTQEPVREAQTISTESNTTASAASATTGTSHDGADLHRGSALPPAVAAKILALYRSRRARRTSLGAIKEIEEALHALQASFVFPTQLDFSPPSSPAAELDATSTPRGAENGLMYTSNNRAVHSYEYALNTLLERLDAVDSQGDTEVRGRRKEVVREVERALRDIERSVEESRERERSREREDVRTPLPVSRSEEAPTIQEQVPMPAPAVDTPQQAVTSPTTAAEAPSVAPAVEKTSQTKDVYVPCDSSTSDAHQDISQPAAATTENIDDARSSPVSDTLVVPSSDSEFAATQPSHTVADLSYAASTLGISVTSVLSSPSALSPLPAGDQPVPKSPGEDEVAPEAKEQETSSTSCAELTVNQDTLLKDVISTSETAQLDQNEVVSEASSSTTNVSAGLNGSEAAPLTAPQPEPVSSGVAEPAHSEHGGDEAEASSSASTTSSESDAFLLSSHPLQDPPRKSDSGPVQQEYEQPEVVRLADADAEADESEEWSEVEA